MEDKFLELLNLNVNDKTDKKKDLTYLSWGWAWGEFKKIYPDAKYTVKKNEQGLPYFFDKSLGYMVYTEVTAGGLTYEMWLPVMDSSNKSMKDEPYTYSTKYGEKTVEQASMFDINKTVMRCLVKNLAMFGLGLYIYNGEDLPEDDKKEQQEEQKKQQQERIDRATKKEPQPITAGTLKQINVLSKQFADLKGVTTESVLEHLKTLFKYADINKLTNEQGMIVANKVTAWIQETKRKRTEERRGVTV